MGKFCDFYVVFPTEAGRAARSAGGSGRWPYYAAKRVDLPQVATLYDLLRGAAGNDTWREFEQRVEADAGGEESPEADEDDAGPVFLIAIFPADLTERLAGLGEPERGSLAERWQGHAGFFWSRKAGAAAEIVGELCRFASLALERREVVILVESGE